MTIRGATYPLQTGSDGLIETSDDADVLMTSALRQYLLSERGARVMRPLWGASTGDLLFAPNDDVSRQLFAVRAKDAEKFLPIIVDDIEFRPVPGRKDKIAPTVFFHVIGDENTHNQIDFANPMTSDPGGVA